MIIKTPGEIPAFFHVRLVFTFLHGAFVADVEASAAKYAFILIDHIGNTDFDAAFRAQQGASAAGHTPV